MDVALKFAKIFGLVLSGKVVLLVTGGALPQLPFATPKSPLLSCFYKDGSSYNDDWANDGKSVSIGEARWKALHKYCALLLFRLFQRSEDYSLPAVCCCYIRWSPWRKPSLSTKGCCSFSFYHCGDCQIKPISEPGINLGSLVAKTNHPYCRLFSANGVVFTACVFHPS